jgi:hypothetical protein
MAFIPATNCLRVAMQYDTVTGDNAENVFYVQNSVPWTITTITSMLNAFITWFTVGAGGANTFQSQIANGCTLVEVTGRDLTTQNGFSIASNTGLPIAGIGGATGAVPGITFALTARTGLAGPSFRGRVFLVNPATGFFASTSLGTINASNAGNCVSALNALITAVTSNLATAKLVVASFRHNNAPRVNAVTTNVTTYGFHNLFQDFQRRRSPGHHRHH